MNEFEQAAMRYQKMTEHEKNVFTDNVTESLMFAEEGVQQKVLEHFSKVDDALGKILKKRLRF